MSGRYSLKTYRAIDLTLFAVILYVFESIIVKASTSALFRDQAFTVSLAASVTTIVFLRWGWFGLIHAALAGITYCVAGGGNWKQLAVYALGNLLSACVVPFIKKAGSDKMLGGKWQYLVAGLSVLILMQTGRAAVSLVMGSNLSDALRFYTTDSLSAVFTLVVLWVAHRLDGICEDQMHYLARIQREADE